MVTGYSAVPSAGISSYRLVVRLSTFYLMSPPAEGLKYLN